MAIGASEYIYTFGIIVAFVGLIAGAVLDRENIMRVLKEHKFDRRSLLIALAVVALFLVIEIFIVKPTQLLFFDDAIYQGMAQDLLHMGQAWMCDYGTPAVCYSGELFHEPLGLSFNFAIAFAIFGVHQYAAQGAELALAAISVFMGFLVALLLFKEPRAACFSELLMALSPVILVWAMPTNSDMALLAYSLVALFFLLVFIRRRSRLGLMNLLLAFSLTLYMKVVAALYIPVFLLAYLLLEDGSVMISIRKNLGRIKVYGMDTRVLVILLLFVMVVAPALNYASIELSSGDYGYGGTMIQNTCNRSLPGTRATGNMNLANFEDNICSNVFFWFNQYEGDYVMQPVLFTALACVGAALMLFDRRRELLVLGTWFMVFFLFYTSFYAGSVGYGVDWRFMLSLVAQASILGGFAVSTLVSWAYSSMKRINKRGRAALRCAVLLIAIAIVIYPAYSLAPRLSISPSRIPQAPDARFYEGFVYNESGMIPQDCLVYTYDPALFNINNRTATQMSDLYNISRYNQFRSQYRCLVLDYGYWCHTPNNICAYAEQRFSLTPIATATFNSFGYRYGFYYITGRNGSG